MILGNFSRYKRAAETECLGGARNVVFIEELMAKCEPVDELVFDISSDIVKTYVKLSHEKLASAD